jgi:hypothetical protein
MFLNVIFFYSTFSFRQSKSGSQNTCVLKVFLYGKTHVSYIFHMKKHRVLLPVKNNTQI